MLAASPTMASKADQSSPTGPRLDLRPEETDPKRPDPGLVDPLDIVHVQALLGNDAECEPGRLRARLERPESHRQENRGGARMAAESLLIGLATLRPRRCRGVAPRPSVLDERTSARVARGGKAASGIATVLLGAVATWRLLRWAYLLDPRNRCRLGPDNPASARYEVMADWSAHVNTRSGCVRSPRSRRPAQ